MSLNLNEYRAFDTGFLISDRFFYKLDTGFKVTDIYKKAGFFRSLFIEIAEKFGIKSTEYQKSQIGSKEFYVMKVTDRDQFGKINSLISKTLPKVPSSVAPNTRVKPPVEVRMERLTPVRTPLLQTNALQHAVLRMRCIKDFGAILGADALNKFGKKQVLKALNNELNALDNGEALSPDRLQKVKVEVDRLLNDLLVILEPFDKAKALRDEEKKLSDFLNTPDTQPFTNPRSEEQRKNVVATQRLNAANRLAQLQAMELPVIDISIRDMIKEKCQKVDKQFADKIEEMPKSDLGFCLF